MQTRRYCCHSVSSSSSTEVSSSFCSCDLFVLNCTRLTSSAVRARRASLYLEHTFEFKLSAKTDDEKGFSYFWSMRRPSSGFPLAIEVER